MNRKIEDIKKINVVKPLKLDCGKTVGEVELPENAALAAIVRDTHVITPKDHDVFTAGDELLFVASSVAEEKLKSCFI